ncbi:right-handed parallel beta-helix repeat-containing protein [Patescibacteria group bacterium]|nr:right-handed parallel beta-helix repeat-containing protein [Patescibacteria group bacterium]MBU1673117.1 right-handed parallel beta-helix repeat-containing protein [Patescibacteria group bacterium]MBU1963795.1 right-handed parallel beta-helix repeat-containing protein [Patescibacteria group bacterium]
MKKLIFISALFLGLAALPTGAFAADFYIDFDNGDNNNNCATTSTPCETFDAAALGGSIAPGDTIYATGTYDLTTASGAGIRYNIDGADNNPITITAWPGVSMPIIDGTDLTTAYSLWIDADYVTWDGFTVVGVETADNDVAVFVDGQEEITVSNNIIYGPSAGVFDTYGVNAQNTTGFMLLNNTIYNVYDNQVWIDDGHIIIDGNKFYDVVGNNFRGLALDSISEITVTNNFFYDFDSNGEGLRCDDISGSEIINNTFYNNDENVQFYGTLGTDHEFKNNLLIGTNTTQYGIMDRTAAVQYFNRVESDYNLFYMGASDVTAARTFPTLNTYPTLANWQASGYGQDENSLDNDPKIAGSGDLHLTNESPAVDAGDNVSAESTYLNQDIDKEPRPYGPAYDIGADERPVLAVVPHTLSWDPLVLKMTLDWMQEVDYAVTNFNVKFGTDSNLAGADVYLADNSGEYLKEGLKAAKVYYYAVQGQYETGYQTYYSAWSGIKKVVTKPVKVKDLWKINKYENEKRVKIRWKMQKRATKYRIKLYKYKKSTQTYRYFRTIVRTKAETHYKKNGKLYKNGAAKTIIKNLKPGKYKFKVRAARIVDDVNYKGKYSPKTRFQHFPE